MHILLLSYNQSVLRVFFYNVPSQALCKLAILCQLSLVCYQVGRGRGNASELSQRPYLYSVEGHVLVDYKWYDRLGV